ncbi:MAG TPA: rhomboid family intramembrane serine protease [Dongiaceae bacterium]|nr:rhomboid family intramembrane serine protease [Dongiaceae bacterium]
MFPQPVITLLVCVVTVLVSLVAFTNDRLRERLLFRPEAILAHKQWDRLFSSALIHADWMHLGFNLFALYSFGSLVEEVYGRALFLGIYVASILGGSLLSLWLHRHHDYAALGASGGVCGVMFAAIFLVPGTGVGMMFLPLTLPGPVFAGGYLVLTFIALRRRQDNVGHDAHFGGACVGLLLAAAIEPNACLQSRWFYLACLLFCIGCLYVLGRNPLGLRESVLHVQTPAHRCNLRYQRYDEAAARRQEQEKVDELLDKISARGLHSLSSRERAFLAEYSARKGNR